MAKKKKNNKILWIIGTILVYVLFFNPSSDKKTGFGCDWFDGGGTPSKTCEWVSNEPNTVNDFYNFLVNGGHTIGEAKLEPQCADNVCIGPSLIASMDVLHFSILGFPTFLDGQDITVNNCLEFLNTRIKVHCGESTGIYKNSCDECTDLGYSRCYSSSDYLGQQILIDSTYGYNHIIPVQSETTVGFVCSSNNKYVIIIPNNNKNLYADKFYEYQCN